MKLLSPLLLLVFLLSGCIIDTVQEATIPLEVEGLRPIYADSDTWQDIDTDAPHTMNKLGKIYYKDEILYVTEAGKGVHIIDNSDPTNPLPIKYLKIAGCNDVAIKGNYLYADNVTDLVVLNIMNLDDIQLEKRVPNLYPMPLNYPDGYIGWFECVDEGKGLVVGWEAAILMSPECRRD